MLLYPFCTLYTFVESFHVHDRHILLPYELHFSITFNATIRHSDINSSLYTVLYPDALLVHPHAPVLSPVLCLAFRGSGGGPIHPRLRACGAAYMGATVGLTCEGECD